MDAATRDAVVSATYFVAAVTFILGLKGLSGPRTAVLGNRVAAAGMLLALAATFLVLDVGSLPLILGGMAVGTAIGVYGARAVPMTAMPQMVALFNGAGGGAAAVVSILEAWHTVRVRDLEAGEAVSISLGLLIGAVSLSGSLVAFGKLQGIVDPKAFRYPGQRIVTAIVFLAMLGLAAWLVYGAAADVHVRVLWVLGAMTLLALLFGVVLVMPIGGADMPVVISLLNAYTGLAVAAAGFVLGNQLLIIAGTLVGASGTILTRLMSKAMNRSLANVLFGAFGAGGAAGAAGARTDDGRTARSTTVEDAAALLGYARSVVIVPGYGLAVAQAQHAVRELADVLQARGATVKYAIHPVAGRMPGHMNVLLAEANVPYEQLVEMDEINPEFPRTDVALVVGANDVTNPAARSSPGSPIYGMPILDVDRAQNIIVVKRSMRPGFAGIDNDLYLDPKCAMLFGDAKDALSKLTAEVKKV